jgi:MFS transporter, YQGE family, putative transporter
VNNIILNNGTVQWNFARGITALLGMLSGILTFLPALLVLQYIGKENALGITQSIAAVISGVIMYSIARTFNTQFRINIIAFSIGLMLISGLILAFAFNPVGIFIFISLMTISHQVLMVETNSVILDLVDRENTSHDQKYKYVFDLEMVLNVGRVTGIMFFVFYTKVFSSAFAVQFTPLFFAIAMGAIVFLAKHIENSKETVEQQQELAESYVTGQQVQQ